MFFRRVFGSVAESNSKNLEGETFRHLARARIRSNEVCLSPRSIRPRCLTSISTFSATCQIFSFLDFRTERTNPPNCDAAVTEVPDLDSKRGSPIVKPPQKSLIN